MEKSNINQLPYFLQENVLYAEDIALVVSFLPMHGTLAMTSPVAGFCTYKITNGK